MKKTKQKNPKKKEPDISELHQKHVEELNRRGDGLLIGYEARLATQYPRMYEKFLKKRC